MDAHFPNLAVAFQYRSFPALRQRVADLGPMVTPDSIARQTCRLTCLFWQAAGPGSTLHHGGTVDPTGSVTGLPDPHPPTPEFP